MIRFRLAHPLLLLCVTLAAADPPIRRQCLPERVIDGDTIVCTVAGVSEHVRLVGVDTPEMRARCDWERTAAAAATEETSRRIWQAKETTLVGAPTARDRYRRLLARVETDGEDLSGILIAGQFGVPYSGRKRRDWCAQPLPAAVAPSS